MGNVSSKTKGGILGTIVCGIGITAGIVVLLTIPAAAPLTLCFVGKAMIGGALLGAGMSSGVNTVKQCMSDEKEFSIGKWAAATGIGCLGGAITAPISFAGGTIASGLFSEPIYRGAFTIGTEIVGGALSGAITTPLSKAAAGEKWSWKEDVLGGIFVGGVSGAVGGAFGLASSKACSIGAKQCVEGTPKAMLTRGLIGTGVGIAGGSVGGVTTKFLENLVEGKRLSTGLGEAAIQGAVVGGVSGLISSGVKAEKKRRQVAIESSTRYAAQNTTNVELTRTSGGGDGGGQSRVNASGKSNQAKVQVRGRDDDHKPNGMSPVLRRRRYIKHDSPPPPYMEVEKRTDQNNTDQDDAVAENGYTTVAQFSNMKLAEVTLKQGRGVIAGPVYVTGGVKASVCGVTSGVKASVGKVAGGSIGGVAGGLNASIGGVSGGVSGGVTGGVQAGVGGVSGEVKASVGGVTGGLAGEVKAGVYGGGEKASVCGVTGGVSGGEKASVCGVTGGVAGGVKLASEVAGEVKASVGGVTGGLSGGVKASVGGVKASVGGVTGGVAGEVKASVCGVTGGVAGGVQAGVGGLSGGVKASVSGGVHVSGKGVTLSVSSGSIGTVLLKSVVGVFW